MHLKDADSIANSEDPDQTDCSSRGSLISDLGIANSKDPDQTAPLPDQTAPRGAV